MLQNCYLHYSYLFIYKKFYILNFKLNMEGFLVQK